MRQSLADSGNLGDIAIGVAQDIGDAMGNIPQSLSGADRAMRNAVKSLKRGTKGGAQASQEQAAGQMDEAAQSLSDQMSENESTQIDGNGRGKGKRDPFNRTTPNIGSADGRIDVPTARQLQRSREILNEVRRRSGDRSRSRMELEYLQRLMKGF